MRKLGKIAAVMGMFAATVLVPASAAHAANPGPPGEIAFIRGGNLWIGNPLDHSVSRATTDGGWDWPRWRPGASGEMAILHNGNLWVAEWFAGGDEFFPEQQLTFGSGNVGAASWSPDGTRLAYDMGHGLTGTIFIARFGSSAVTAKPTITKTAPHLTPAAQRQLATARKSAAVKPKATGGTWSPLRTSLNVAWAPNGKWISFPNGDCEGIFDNCLSVFDVNTNAEWFVNAFGGGGDIRSGYDTVPAFTADSSVLSWTQQVSDPEGTNTIGKLQIFATHPDPDAVGPQFQIGSDGDSVGVPSPANDGNYLITEGHNGKAWVTLLAPNGHRTFMFQGYEQDWQAGQAD